MEITTGVLLGLVQGFSEFLPISSSGHLVIVQSLLPGFSQPGILFESVLHLGTLLAVIYYFKKNILKYPLRFWILVGIGTIPATIVGLLFKTEIETLFGQVKTVGFFLLITGMINLLIDRFKERESKLNTKSALMIGTAQAIAVIPGISRSGSTIFAGTGLGLSKKDAAEFSFLLSIPAILGANVLQILDYGTYAIADLEIFLAGFAAAFVGGILSIKLLMTLLLESKFKYFGIYTIIAGILVLFLL